MPRSLHARLVDMRDAAGGIRETLDSVNFDAFQNSWLMQRAVERGLEIISEASRALSADMKRETSDVPWTQIGAIGNVLRHEYQRVEPRIVWNITHEHLPRLEAAVQKLLDTQTKADEAGN